jgi:hypothetical protein
MADPTRPDPPALEPARTAALGRLVDALTAPGTPEELAEEEAYVAAFVAAIDGRDAAARLPGEDRGRRRNRRGRRVLRIALPAGVAALAVTSTAAALTGSFPGSGPPQPTRSPRHVETPTTTAHHAGRTPPSPSSASPSPAGRASSPSPGTPTTMPPSRARPTSVSAVPPSSPSESSDTARTQPTPHPATPALVNLCRQLAGGQLRAGTGGYRALLAAAGTVEAIPAYCASITPPGSKGTP